MPEIDHAAVKRIAEVVLKYGEDVEMDELATAYLSLLAEREGMVRVPPEEPLEPLTKESIALVHAAEICRDLRPPADIQAALKKLDSLSAEADIMKAGWAIRVAEYYLEQLKLAGGLDDRSP